MTKELREIRYILPSTEMEKKPETEERGGVTIEPLINVPIVQANSPVVKSAQLFADAAVGVVWVKEFPNAKQGNRTIPTTKTIFFAVMIFLLGPTAVLPMLKISRAVLRSRDSAI